MCEYTLVDHEMEETLTQEFEGKKMYEVTAALRLMNIEISSYGVRDPRRPWEKTVYIRTQRPWPFHVAPVWIHND